MKKTLIFPGLLAALLLLFSCKSQQKSSPVEFTFVQINDVYEIQALEGGTVGGMARFATLVDSLEAENPNTWAFLAGDFVNPSVMGNVKYEDEKLKGKQMIDLMNKSGIDYVTFGNHEFDIKEHELQARIDESEFVWVSSNVDHVTIPEDTTQPNDTANWVQHIPDGDYPCPETVTLKIPYGEGETLKVGILGVTLDNSNPIWTDITDANEQAKKAYDELKADCQIVVGLTHLSMGQDHELAKHLGGGLTLIMGGHEHENMDEEESGTAIRKADANAKTAWVHKFSWDPATQAVSLNSELVSLNDEISFEPEAQKAVEKWVEITYEGLEADGFHPDEVVAELDDSLDGRESSNRTHRTNLGTLISESMIAAAGDADCAILNSGSIRVDDVIQGVVTEYDIIRILPFGGPTVTVPMKGSTLREALEIGSADELKGNGGFLQYANISNENGTWMVGDSELDDNKTYKVAGGDYLIYHEKPYIDVFAGIRAKAKIEPANGLQEDVRQGLIDYMKKM